MKTLCRISLILLASLVSQNMSAFPSVIPTCPRNSPRLADCIKEVIELLRPQTASGYFSPSLYFDDKLDPLIVGDITIKKSFNMKLRGLKVRGVNNYRIEKLRINTDNFKLEMLVTIPKIEGTSQYSLQWAISLLNIQGSGEAKVFMENLKVHLKFIGSRYLKNGIEYLKFDHCDIKIKSAKVRVYFFDLFTGNKALEATANEVINQNIDTFVADIYPTIEQVLATKLLRISNRIFALGSFNEILPLQ